MVEFEKNENLDICRECGGKCCIKCGCDYSAEDFFDLSYKGILNVLSKGDKSVVAFVKFKTLANGKFIAEPFLYLRARNTNRDIVDLISMKTRCSQLGDNGCSHSYDERPFGGKNLIPVRRENGICQPLVDPYSIVETWRPYQNQLRKVVKQYTGMSVEKRISQDAENLFYDVMSENYQDVSLAEKKDLRNFVPLMVNAFPEEFVKAKARYMTSGPMLINKL